MNFQDFIGNRKAVESVRQMLVTERISPALLFTGPEGVGKLTLAKIFAQAIHCEQEKADTCGHCRACRKTSEMFEAAEQDLQRRRDAKSTAQRVENLVYFDVQLIEPVTQFILTSQINKAVSSAYAKPFEFPRRIFILNDAHRIHWTGVDRLLKVLEEPPVTTLFILICPNAFSLRATIRSRCRQVSFALLEEEEMQEVLGKQTRWSVAQRRLVARLSGGSLGKARSLDLEDYEQRRDHWLAFFEQCLSGSNWGGLFRTTEVLGKDRENFEANLSLAYSLLRDLVMVQVTGREEKLANLDLGNRLRKWSKRVDLRWIERVSRALDQAHREQIRNMNQQLGLDALAAELAPITGPKSAPRGSD